MRITALLAASECANWLKKGLKMFRQHLPHPRFIPNLTFLERKIRYFVEWLTSSMHVIESQKKVHCASFMKYVCV